MNITIFYLLYSFAHQTPFLDSLIIFCAKYLQYPAILFLILYLFLHYVGEFNFKKPFSLLKIKIKEIFLIFTPAVFSWFIADIFKKLFFSPRPFIALKDTVQPLFFHGGFDSFPSGHAIFFSALAISGYFVHKRVGRVYIIFALIIGLARIMAGIHFPVDILAGYLFGILVSLIFNVIFSKKNKDKNLDFLSQKV